MTQRCVSPSFKHRPSVDLWQLSHSVRSRIWVRSDRVNDNKFASDWEDSFMLLISGWYLERESDKEQHRGIHRGIWVSLTIYKKRKSFQCLYLWQGHWGCLQTVPWLQGRLDELGGCEEVYPLLLSLCQVNSHLRRKHLLMFSELCWIMLIHHNK